MIKTFEDFLNENQNIDENIDFEQLNESFTNQELKDAIKAHGGLSSFILDARKESDKFNLKNAKYVGYLNPEIYKDICDSGCYLIIYKSLDFILFTKDGGAIIINDGDEYLGKDYNEWVKKMKIRNNNWVEDEVSEKPENSLIMQAHKQDIRYDRHKKPDEYATSMRRYKHINRNKK